jgi:5-methylthioribose kinase
LFGQGFERMRNGYEALTAKTLPARLDSLPCLKTLIGEDANHWRVKEVGDGNLNLVFIVSGPTGTVIVKQALPYVRLVGDSWPLPLYRAFYEYNALTRQAERTSGMVPEIFHFDETQAMIIMEFLTPHKILRGKLILGERVDGLAEKIGKFCAQTAFRGSDLSLKTSVLKADRGLFCGNVEIPAITEALVFCDPYFDAEMNSNTPELAPVVAILRNDIEMKTGVQWLFRLFSAQQDTMCHGDLHSGSIMCTAKETKVIDPEFAFYGPFGFDLGMLFANYLMAYFSQPAHRTEGSEKYQDWILDVVEQTYTHFTNEFTELWQSERTGMLYPKELFEDQGHSSETALQFLLEEIWQNCLGFCGIEMHRRCLSLAHNADFETIENTSIRASLEAKNLMMGRDLILNRRDIKSTTSLKAKARKFNQESFL